MAGVDLSSFFTTYGYEYVSDGSTYTTSEVYLSQEFITYGYEWPTDASDVTISDVFISHAFVTYGYAYVTDEADVNVHEVFIGSVYVLVAYATPPYNIEDRGYYGADEMIYTDIVFPQCIVYGSSVSPRYLTDKLEIQSGAEQRNARHEYPKHVYRILLENMTSKDLSDIVRLYHAVSGDFTGFLLIDPLDNTSNDDQTGYYSAQTISGHDQLVAMGDGVTTKFNLYKYYTHNGRQKRRRIRHPDADSLIIFVDGKDMSPCFSWNTGLQQLQFLAKTGDIVFNAVSMVGQKITGFDATAYDYDINDLIWVTGWPPYANFTHTFDNNAPSSGQPLRIIAIDSTGLTVERYNGTTTNFGNEGPFDVTVRHVAAIPNGKLVTSGYSFKTAVRFDEAAMEIEPKAGLRENLIATLDSVVLRELFE